MSSVIIFILNGSIDYKVGVVLFVGILVRGYLDAHATIKKGNKWVKFIFTAVVIASAIKILLS